MARPRCPQRSKAFEMWLKFGNKRLLKDIAAELNVPASRVRKWKVEDKWEKKRSDNDKGSEASKPRRAPIGNRNAAGNPGGAGKASGAVAFYHPSNSGGKALATNIVKELNAICPVKSNRSTSVASDMNAFNGSGYGEARTPNQYGLITVLAETDFHDNSQAAQWIINSKDAIARAYVVAIVNTFNIAKKQVPPVTLPPATPPRYYRVQ